MPGDSMNGNGVDLNDLFPGPPQPKNEYEEARDKALKAHARAVKYGWAWVEVGPGVITASREDTWGKAFRHYMWAPCSAQGVRCVPEWLNVLLDALVPKWRAEYVNKKTGKVESQLGKMGGFLEMAVGWCANGGKDALEGRARPLAAVIMLCAGRADVERRANTLINEVGY